MFEIPEVLKGLKLFEQDSRLCARINLLMFDWKQSYPHVDIKVQIAWAHSWLISSGSQKKDYGRFLNNWMKNEERRMEERRQGDRRKVPGSPPPDYSHIREADVMSGEDWKKIKEHLRKSP